MKRQKRKQRRRNCSCRKGGWRASDGSKQWHTRTLSRIWLITTFCGNQTQAQCSRHLFVPRALSQMSHEVNRMKRYH